MSGLPTKSVAIPDPDPKPLQRLVDAALEVKPTPVVWDAHNRQSMFAKLPNGAYKPRENAEYVTTESGTFRVQLVTPTGKIIEFTRVLLTVPAAMLGVLSVRTAAGVRAEPKPEEVVDG